MLSGLNKQAILQWQSYTPLPYRYHKQHIFGYILVARFLVLDKKIIEGKIYVVYPKQIRFSTNTNRVYKGTILVQTICKEIYT